MGGLVAIGIGYLLVLAGLSTACGFGARAIMMGKGRSGQAGFWLGFLLGLLGVLIAALLSPVQQYQPWAMQGQMQQQPGGGQFGAYGAAVANPARWAPDPMGRHELRYWDGCAWSQNVSDRGVVSVDDGRQASAVAASPMRQPEALPAARSTSAAVPQPLVQPPRQPFSPPSVESTVPRASGIAPGVPQIVFDSGQRVSLSTAVVVGRVPVAQGHLPGAQLVAFDDASLSVSATHFAIGHDAGGVWFEDLGSTNGSAVVDGSGGSQVARAGARVYVPRGGQVQFGECSLTVDWPV